jgi:8-oxo-dGTP pyrophosphatase MutT (NUDIX family)
MKRMGSGALIRDEHGAVLLVETSYKSFLEVPGGAVEADESPRQACTREIEEELGLRIEVGRLLCMEWQGPEPDRSESLMFIYDGGVVTGPFNPTLKTDELRAFRFVSPSELDAVTIERLARRLRAALDALARGTLAELENGEPISHECSARR